MTEKDAGEIVNRIIVDICDRSGIGDEWEFITPDIQDDIKREWITIILEVVKEAAHDAQDQGS